jgi:hypothetical protein
MHKNVAEKTSAARQRAIDERQGQRPAVPLQSRGFFLRGMLPRHQQRKIAVRLVGPYRVTQVYAGFIYVLEYLLTGKCQEVHTGRVRFFWNSEFEVTQTVLAHLSYESPELHTIEKLVGIRGWHGYVEEGSLAWARVLGGHGM